MHNKLTEQYDHGYFLYNLKLDKELQKFLKLNFTLSTLIEDKNKISNFS